MGQQSHNCLWCTLSDAVTVIATVIWERPGGKLRRKTAPPENHFRHMCDCTILARSVGCLSLRLSTTCMPNVTIDLAPVWGMSVLELTKTDPISTAMFLPFASNGASSSSILNVRCVISDVDDQGVTDNDGLHYNTGHWWINVQPQNCFVCTCMPACTCECIATTLEMWIACAGNYMITVLRVANRSKPTSSRCQVWAQNIS